MTARHQCSRCRISFRIGLPVRVRDDTYTRCSEPGCKQRFWHTDSDIGKLSGARSKFVVCGIEPEDLPELAGTSLSTTPAPRENRQNIVDKAVPLRTVLQHSTPQRPW